MYDQYQQSTGGQPAPAVNTPGGSLYGKYQQTQKGGTGGSLYSQYQQSKLPKAPSVLSQIGSGIKARIGNIVGGIKTVGSDIMGALKAPTESKSLNTNDALKAGWESLSSTIKDAGDRLSTAVDTVRSSHASALQKGVAVGEAGMGALNSVFSIITAPMQTLSRLPVVGPVADGINKLFGAIGTGGADVAEGALDAIPVSQQTKDTLMPLVRETGALAAQILAGKGTDDAISKLTDRSKTILKTIDESAPKAPQAGPEATKLPVKSLPSDYADRIYTPPEKLPTIEMGPKPEAKPSTLPTIQMNPEERPTTLPKAPTGLRYEPIVSEKPAGIEKTPVSVRIPSENASVSTKTTSSGGLKTIPGTGEVKTRALSSGVEAKAIEKTLTDSFGDLPEFRQVNMKDQAARAADIITKDYATARAIAMGEKAAPKGVVPEMMFKAVEDKAIREGDVSTLRDLATGSKLTSAATTMGQRIRTLAERNPESPVGAIKEVQDARAKSLQERYGDVKTAVKKTVENIKDEVKKEISKNSGSKQTWNDFISSLQC